MRLSLTVACSLVVVAVAACFIAPTATQTRELPCDVESVLARNCRTCHSSPPAFGAPMPLVTWNDLQASAVSDHTKKVYDLVAARIHDATRPMPQPPNPRLDTTDMATLDDWIAAGAPPSTGSCADASVDAPSVTLTCAADVHMTPAAAFSMPANAKDLYACYGFDIPITSKRQIVGIAPRLDNTRIIHHLVLFQADRSESSTPGPCDLAAQAKWRLLYGWAPGASSFELPPEAGFPLDEGTAHFVVQIHYNNINELSGQTDSSGFDFCTTDQLRANDADAMVFGAQNFIIAPNSKLDLTCSYVMPPTTPELHVFAALPHMHQIGLSIGTTDMGHDGASPVDLGSRTTWDFNNQIYVDVKATVSAGDVINTRCVWGNTSSTPVVFGPYTENEMCFSYTMYYPRILDPNWSFEQPAIGATCLPTTQ